MVPDGIVYYPALRGYRGGYFPKNNHSASILQTKTADKASQPWLLFSADDTNVFLPFSHLRLL
jgi:hypothetical protein